MHVICLQHAAAMRAEMTRHGLGRYAPVDEPPNPTEVFTYFISARQTNRRSITIENFNPIALTLGMVWDFAHDFMPFIVEQVMPHIERYCAVCLLDEMRTPNGACNCKDPGCVNKTPGSIPGTEDLLPECAVRMLALRNGLQSAFN